MDSSVAPILFLNRFRPAVRAMLQAEGGMDPNRVAAALVASPIVRRNAILQYHLLREYPVVRHNVQKEAGSKLSRWTAAVGTFVIHLLSVLRYFVRKEAGSSVSGLLASGGTSAETSES